MQSPGQRAAGVVTPPARGTLAPQRGNAPSLPRENPSCQDEAFWDNAGTEEDGSLSHNSCWEESTHPTRCQQQIPGRPVQPCRVSVFMQWQEPAEFSTFCFSLF